MLHRGTRGEGGDRQEEGEDREGREWGEGEKGRGAIGDMWKFYIPPDDALPREEHLARHLVAAGAALWGEPEQA